MRGNPLERFLQVLHALESATADLVDLLEDAMDDLTDVLGDDEDEVDE